MLAFVIMRTKLAMNRTASIEQYQDFMLTPGGVDLFDATCMRLQTIGETMKQINAATNELLLKQYIDISWRDIYGLRNIISHEYLSIDPEAIFDIVKNELPPLLITLQHIEAALDGGKHNEIFKKPTQ